MLKFASIIAAAKSLMAGSEFFPTMQHALTPAIPAIVDAAHELEQTVVGHAASLESVVKTVSDLTQRATVLESTVPALSPCIQVLQSQVASLESRLAALEARPCQASAPPAPVSPA